MHRRQLASLAATLVLAVTHLTVHPQNPDPALPLTPAECIKAQNSSTLAGIPRVAIPTFLVQLVRDQGIERSGGSFGMFQGRPAA